MNIDTQRPTIDTCFMISNEHRQDMQRPITDTCFMISNGNEHTQDIRRPIKDTCFMINNEHRHATTNNRYLLYDKQCIQLITRPRFIITIAPRNNNNKNNNCPT